MRLSGSQLQLAEALQPREVSRTVYPQGSCLAGGADEFCASSVMATEEPQET